MSKKFRVGQKVVVGGEYDGEIVGEQHTKKHGKVWLVRVEGEEHPILDKDLAPASGNPAAIGEVEDPEGDGNDG